MYKHRIINTTEECFRYFFLSFFCFKCRRKNNVLNKSVRRLSRRQNEALRWGHRWEEEFDDSRMRSARFYGDLSITLFTALIYTMTRKRSETKDFDQIYNAARERQAQRNAVPVSISLFASVYLSLSFSLGENMYIECAVHWNIWCENILSLFILYAIVCPVQRIQSLEPTLVTSHRMNWTGEANIIVACVFISFHFFDAVRFHRIYV